MKDKNVEHDLQQVVNTCIELQNSGKTPSVGMIKAKLLTPLSIPVIIKGLSYWKENKATVRTTALPTQEITEGSNTLDLHSRVSQLENEVAAVRAALKALQQRS